MSKARADYMYAGIAIIGLCTLLVFCIYFKMNNKQMEQLKVALDSTKKANEEAKAAEEKARILAQKNETAIQVIHKALKSGMWSMEFDENANMTSCTWSDELRHMIGYENETDFPNKLESWSDLLHKEDKERVLKEFNDTIKDYTNEKTYDVEYRLLTAKNGYRWFHASGKLSRREDGSPIEYFGLFVDITDKINSQNQLKAALKATEEAREEAIAANKAKSEFLSNMSHDIRTPMNAIVGMTAIATDHIDDQNRVKDCLKKITLSGKHLLGLINDVLDMSKIEIGKMTLNLEALSLKQTMETMCDIVRPQIKSHGQNFDIFISNIISEEVYCDSVRINQVLLNFLSNSMKFTPEGGNISINLRQEESPKGADYVRTHICVKDTGMGMSEEFQKKLFTAFEREDNRRVHKTQGTGLGMTITKYIIDAMGGTINVESKVGVGTTFHITVDFEKVKVSLENMKLPDWKILVVDDNEELLNTASLSLKELGTKPETCTSGEEAIKLVKEAEQKDDSYFAVLIDYKMNGMSGVETAKEIRKLVHKNIPISIISAYDWSDIEEEAKTAGITGFIPKPLFKSTLYHELRKYCCDEEKEANTFPEKKVVDITGFKILLAEDNDINAEIASMILRESGCVVERAEDGKIATEMFEKSEENYFDAILMDLRMPHMNGIEATEVIRKMKRADAEKIPIIAMTADAFAEDAKKCLAAGMNAHLAKPIDIEQLKNTLAKFVNKK